MSKKPVYSPDLRIRRARAADAPRIAALTTQLGYRTSPARMAIRLKPVLRAKNAACFVGETKPEGVIGWTHVSVTPLLEVERRAELNGLVVDERVRSRGAGARFLEEAEKWARKMRCTEMSVRSNVIRERAHHFYLREGYEHNKTQKTFRKVL
jgi:GNAT superfamily N-acetyltransferase